MAPYSELVGYDEIVGDDDPFHEGSSGLIGADAADALLAMASGEYSGAVNPQLAHAMQAMRAQQAAARSKASHFAPRVVDVKSVGARAPRDLVIGFDSDVVQPGGVLAGQTLTIAVLPQVIFRGSRLLIPSDIAGSFLIADIIVGNRSQLVASGSLPGRAFQENSLNNRVMLDTASVSQQVILKVTNTSLGALRFNAALFGVAAIP